MFMIMEANERIPIKPLTSNEHDTNGKDLLWVGVGRDVAKAHAGQTAEGEVESRDVLVFNGRARSCWSAKVTSVCVGKAAILVWHHANNSSTVRSLSTWDGVIKLFSQLVAECMEPPNWAVPLHVTDGIPGDCNRRLSKSLTLQQPGSHQPFFPLDYFRLTTKTHFAVGQYVSCACFKDDVTVFN